VLLIAKLETVCTEVKAALFEIVEATKLSWELLSPTAKPPPATLAVLPSISVRIKVVEPPLSVNTAPPSPAVARLPEKVEPIL